MLKERAGANKNLMLLTRMTITILRNPDKVKLFNDITQHPQECCKKNDKISRIIQE